MKVTNMFDKKLIFEPKLSNKILSQKDMSYCVCFSTLNDIMSGALGLNLIQPISKQVNQYSSDKLTDKIDSSE